MNKEQRISPALLAVGIAAALALAVLPPLLLRLSLLWFITPVVALVALAGVFFKRAWLLTLSASLLLIVIVLAFTKAYPTMTQNEKNKLYSTGQIVKGDVYYVRADYPRALEAYRQSETQWIIDPWIEYQRARCYNYTGQNQTAFELYLYLAKYPFDIPPEMLETDLALAALKAYLFEDGEALFTQAIDQNFRPGYSFFQLGVFNRMNAQGDKAEEMFTKAHRLGYERSDCSSLLGEIAEDRKNYALAEELYRRGLHESFENLALYAKLGSLLHRLGRTDEALKILLDGFNIATYVPFNPRATAMILNNLGYIYGDQGKSGQAIMAFKQAIHSDPTFYDSYDNLAYVYMQTGRNAEALQILQTALKMDPNHETARQLINQITGGYTASPDTVK